MAALSSVIDVPVVTVGVICTAGRTVPRVIVCPVDPAVAGPKYSIPPSTSSPQASPVFPAVEYSDSMSMKVLLASSFM